MRIGRANITGLILLDHLISCIPAPKASHGSMHPNYEGAVQVASCRLFDEAYYLSQAGEDKPVDCYPALHYFLHGHKIGLEPNRQFNTPFYRDQAKIDKTINPLVHYLETGQAKGLRTTPDVGSARTAPEYKTPVCMSPCCGQMTFEEGRVAYILAKIFQECGHPVYISRNSDLYRYQHRFKFYQKLVHASWVRLIDSSADAPDNAIDFTDDMTARSDKLLLWVRSKPSKYDHAFIQPYTMHPTLYDFGTHRNLKWLRQHPRCARIFFAGDIGWKFRIRLVQLLHGMLPRHRMIELVQQYYGGFVDQKITDGYRPGSRSEESPPILILDQRKQRSPAVLWPRFLASADFFIAGTGAYCPFAHNVIEAMSVGTIPIIEYGAYFYPELEDGVNCLGFSGKKGYLAAIQRALDMDMEAIAQMRAKVIEYYDKYLDLRRFIERLHLGDDSNKRIYFQYESRLKSGWAEGLHG